MYITGERVNVGQFSREMVGGMIEDYVTNAKEISPRRWAQIMRAIGAVQTPEADRPTPNAPTMAQKRRVLYVRSSPAPEN